MSILWTVIIIDGKDMKTTLFLILLLFYWDSSAKEVSIDSLLITSLVMDSIPPKPDLKNGSPVFGYRFVIEGDFDGDGKREALTEHYVSTLDNNETDKFYEDMDYDELVALTVKKAPYSFLLSDNPLIDTMRISTNAQQFGLAYLKNEGDLNGDGTDEISYVINYADWSSSNTWHIATYKNGQWQTLYRFAIWDWQLPDLPDTHNRYGLFGLEDKTIIPANDTLNRRIEQNLLDFEGLVKKMENNRIRIIYSNDEAELDTMIIRLK